MDWRIDQEAVAPAVFPPAVIVEIKALACELPSERNLPFSRFSHADIAREAVSRGIVASISGATVWRWLSADAIKPWSWRSWIFPRDPLFAEKAGRVLDFLDRNQIKFASDLCKLRQDLGLVYFGFAKNLNVKCGDPDRGLGLGGGSSQPKAQS